MIRSFYLHRSCHPVKSRITRSLESFAALAVGEEQWERAGREHGMTSAQTALGEDLFTNAYEEGKKDDSG